MKRLMTAALVAGAVLLATASVALASSHEAAPVGANLWDTFKWQFDDFAAHMSLTFEGIKLMFVSPSLGWSMLDGAICGDQSHWAHMLFDSADHALESFFSTVIILTWIGVEVAARVMAFIAGLLKRPTQAPA